MINSLRSALDVALDLQQAFTITYDLLGYELVLDYLVGTDMNLYYTACHPTWHKRPDWFAVLGVSRLYETRDLRLSYVI
jgi:hypothetical protein